jgi:hypothetical protein
MIASSLSLKPPEEITSLEVRCYWERLSERIWTPGYTMYRSPNKELKAIVNDATGQIGLMWNTYTGQVHQNHPEVLLDLVKPLTVEQEKQEAFTEMLREVKEASP